MEKEATWMPMQFDNHDSRICFFELVLERPLGDLPDLVLPSGYGFASYRPGDRDLWIDIEKSAREFSSYEDGLIAWQRYFAASEQILPDRMVFVVNPAGEKVGTATAFFDIRTGDDHENGMLHWVAIRRDEQGKGLSKPLILRALHCMRELGYSRVVVPTQTTTWLACRVYLDLGFRPVPRNAERNWMGWRIVRTLTDHPALREFEPVQMDEIVHQG